METKRDKIREALRVQGMRIYVLDSNSVFLHDRFQYQVSFPAAFKTTTE
jgi:hypothetical protein